MLLSKRVVFLVERSITSPHLNRVVSGYTINAATGALTLIAGSRFPAGVSPISVTVEASGKFAYVANKFNNVSGYTIKAATGALTPIAGSPFPPAVKTR